MQYAGFEFPQIIPFLPRGPIASRLAEFKQHKPRVCGPYYRNVPAENPKSAFFYLQSDFMPDLRWQWADEVDGARIEHTGWFTDEYGDGDKIRGVVFRLAHSRGFLAGWSMGKGMASQLDYGLWDNEVDAAREADRMAESAAENAREEEAKYQAEQEDNEDDA